ncbi:MAG: cytochrome-c peroxidase [Acidobacteria bacterium]|nr:MAG: cytochrome-c peroxidase [Acidobacteriota bacterium]
MRALALLPVLGALSAPIAAAEGPVVAVGLPAGGLTDRDFLDDGRPDPAKVELGRYLFYDKILSGNRNISCATCHHALAGTGDGLSLPVGEGGRGLGVTRDTGRGASAIPARVPRNAPPLFNIGARAYRALFLDGRVEIDPSSPSGYRTPAGDQLPEGLESVLAAQAMFPVASSTEMAGQPGENEIADAAAAGRLAGPDGVWGLLAARLEAIPAYRRLFAEAYPDVRRGAPIRFVDAANAIAAFETVAFRADGSRFDRYLRGDRTALTPAERRGLQLFFGKAECGRCHSGPLLTDHRYHAVAMPQVGPGKGDGPGGYGDYGRERVTGDPRDRFRFRTPSLRNVALTAPYGHDGAYDTLEAVVRHMLDPVTALEEYDPGQLVLPSRPDLDELDLRALEDERQRQELASACELAPRHLSDEEIADLVAFLRALTDPRSLDLRWTVPERVPSGLPVRD